MSKHECFDLFFHYTFDVEHFSCPGLFMFNLKSQNKKQLRNTNFINSNTQIKKYQDSTV